MGQLQNRQSRSAPRWGLPIAHFRSVASIWAFLFCATGKPANWGTQWGLPLAPELSFGDGQAGGRTSPKCHHCGLYSGEQAVPAESSLASLFMVTRKVRYRRTHRHRDNAKLRNKKSVRRHTKIGGRTGAIHEKKTHSTNHFPMRRVISNAPTWCFFGRRTTPPQPHERGGEMKYLWVSMCIINTALMVLNLLNGQWGGALAGIAGAWCASKASIRCNKRNARQ